MKLFVWLWVLIWATLLLVLSVRHAEVLLNSPSDLSWYGGVFCILVAVTAYFTLFVQFVRRKS